MKRFYRLTILFAACFTPLVGGAEITVSSDFEGGSVEILAIDQTSHFLKIAPTDHPGKGWRCWWYFRLDGLSRDKSLTLDVGDAPWATPDRAHVSDNGGQTWRHSAPGIRYTTKRIKYEIPVTNESMWFAWGPPFTPKDAQALVDKTADESPFATRFNLATTREGRATPALKITGPGNSSQRQVIWFQARQHAWESGSSFVAKGLIDYFVSDQPSAAKIREKAIVYLVPVMDIDNAFRGAGGKNQTPQDHNRDWSDSPHWNAVAAAQKHISSTNKKGLFTLFVDLHNPAASNRFPYFYIPPRSHLSEVGSERMNHFLSTAKTHINGPLKFTGRASESGPKYDPKNWTRISKNWVITNTADHVVAVTLETAWNTPSSNIENYQTVGQQLGKTASIFMDRP